MTVPAGGSETFRHVFEGTDHDVINLVRLSILNETGITDTEARVIVRTESDGGDVPIPTIAEEGTDSDRAVTVEASGMRIPTLVCPEKGDKIEVTVETSASTKRVVNVMVGQASAPIIETVA